MSGGKDKVKDKVLKKAEDYDFEMTGISQINISKKWIVIVMGAIFLFLIIAGTMFVISALSRPATINTGGYTGGVDW